MEILLKSQCEFMNEIVKDRRTDSTNIILSVNDKVVPKKVSKSFIYDQNWPMILVN